MSTQQVEQVEQDPRVEQVRAVRLAFEADGNRCLWCEEQVPEDRAGTRSCSDWHAALYQAEQKGRDTCCQICPEKDAVPFTLSQLAHHASTCSTPHRKIRMRRRRNA